jgi:hypothetical protein
MKQSLMNFGLPEDMERYLSYYGYHFNKKLYEFAVSKMKKADKQTRKEERISPADIENLERGLKKYKVNVEFTQISINYFVHFDSNN